MDKVSAKAAGPCCQRLWLATVQRFDARVAAATEVHTLSRPSPNRCTSLNNVTPSIAAIAAAAFGLPPDKVRVVSADTASGPYAGASGGSKVTYTVGAAVLRAAGAAREKLLAAASEELEIAPGDLEVVDGVVRAVGAPDRSITVEEIAQKALRFGGRYEPIEGHGGSAQVRGAPSVSAHLAHVRVDRDTGEVELLRMAIAQDVGRAINPALVEGQMRGGTTQGIGWALFEELAHDESGQLVSGPVSVREIVLRRPDQFPQALTTKLMMYALGRELEYFDMPQVRAVVRAAARDDYRFAAIVTAIVESDAFRMQAMPEAEPNEG